MRCAPDSDATEVLLFCGAASCSSFSFAHRLVLCKKVLRATARCQRFTVWAQNGMPLTVAATLHSVALLERTVPAAFGGC
jgi:hypothetical protein